MKKSPAPLPIFFIALPIFFVPDANDFVHPPDLLSPAGGVTPPAVVAEVAVLAAEAADALIP